MPKFIDEGVLITCEKTIKLFIEKLERESGRNIIIHDLELDDTHLVIKEKELSYVQEQVYLMQDANSKSFNQILMLDKLDN